MAADHIKYDLENGPIRDRSLGANQNPDKSDEYTDLLRYISAYRDMRRKSILSLGPTEDARGPVKRPWWAFWRRPTAQNVVDGEFEVPDEWLETDIHTGLLSTEIEARRKRTGWNELTTEKENLFIKFALYFTGPILYGESLLHVQLGRADIKHSD